MKFSLRFLSLTIIIFSVLFSCQIVFGQTTEKGKLPVIVIPGILGSELVNKETDKLVWFNLRRAKDDDLRLPISTNLAANKDNLVPGDILRNIKMIPFLPESEVYEKLADALVKVGGYTEGNWQIPSETGYQDTFYVYPYDWRRDNVENARLLIRKINQLKVKLKRPDLKFNIVAHSMGGLIARYAAMYGDTDIPSGNKTIVPSWAGTKVINQIVMLGTPNEGSLPSLNSLINGVSTGRVKGIKLLPFIQDISKFDIFTIPAAYQLLPHAKTIRAFDENLNPLNIDIYNPQTWEKYGWVPYSDDKFSKEFKVAEQRKAKKFFRTVLNRAKRFEEALNANIGAKLPIPFYLFGAECKPTLDGMVIYRDKNKWKTLFKADSFRKTNDEKVSGEDVAKLIFAPGDGTVAKRSFLTSSFPNAKVRDDGFQTTLPVNEISFVCEDHAKLFNNLSLQQSLFKILK